MNDQRRGLTEADTFFVAAVIVGPTAWSIGHHVGVEGSVSIGHIHTILAAALSALLASLIAGRSVDGNRLVGAKGTVVLFLPLLWFAVEVVFFDRYDGAIGWLRLALTAATVLLALPYILYIALQSAVPEVAELRHARLRFGLVGIAGFAGLLAYGVGYNKCLFQPC